MKMLQVGLKKVPGHRRLVLGLIALGLAIWMMVLSPIDAVAQPAPDQPKGATSSDLSDIPNLEQMDYDKFEKYVGDVPGDRKPLFNPDNGKAQTIEDKDPRSEKVITPADLQDQTDLGSKRQK